MKKNTKKALFGSVIALILCCAMLIGTTFAWFTDNASTAVNTIQAGTLDIDIIDADDNSLAGKPLSWVDKDGKAITGDILWEPGCTYKLQPFKIVNKGNLAAKVICKLNGVDGDAKLLEALKFTVDYGGMGDIQDLFEDGTYLLFDANGDTSETISISVHMKEEAGNEYQGLSIKGVGVLVQATQRAAESDSFNNSYDADAEFAEAWNGTESETITPDADNANQYTISTAAELKGFADMVNVGKNTFNGKTVVLAADIDLGGQVWTPIGQTSATQFMGTFDGQGHTIENFVVNDTEGGAHSSGLFGWLNNGTIKNVTVVRATVTGNQYVGGIVGYVEFFSSAVVENCHVVNSTIQALNDKAGAVVGYGANAGTQIKGCTATNCNVSAARDAGQVVGAGKTNTVIDCSAENVTVAYNGLPSDKDTNTNIRNEVIGRIV